ncbi:hypothetical protein [Aeromonas phage AS-yj]|uniref:Uncharacterized protein n=7 Tax=Caudoviricetes TaxID=2731619 RepID=A0A291LDM4_9CAUD|nr:hypothetical protein F485_gp013 [Aeromonas phage CC2]YP_009834344.1 hypothetical protein HWB28_gp044 [Aeromonas phage AS-zj]YP_009834976.1 hypothetical protein HWB29_gp274 [Aeromonas phage AS-sw]ATI17489.1 hypothetical protein [Aeromonas phage AS-szw]ATI18021.1 hypothetical protein [Aeromonas phage AS-yj]QAX97929.1 hypothetical protein ASswx1_286 [Aeromonas phage Asswx_1]QAX99021.1 hypothetical protein assk_230 [Aeromonas phage Assk]QMV28896.1 hypothetical protein AP1_0189 [Aeromonas phag
MTEQTCDRNDCYDVTGFPEDTLVTFCAPDIYGDMREQTWTLYQLLEIQQGNRILLKGPETGKYATILRMVDTEFTEPVNPNVWEIHMSNGKSWLCAENHQVLSLYDRKSPYQALYAAQYCTPDGGVVNRVKRVRQYKYKARFWMHIITEDDVPFVLNDTGILHFSSQKKVV